MMQSALDMFLRRFITIGRLAVRWPDGRTKIYAGATRARGGGGVARPRHDVAFAAKPQAIARGSLCGRWPGSTRLFDPRCARRSSWQISGAIQNRPWSPGFGARPPAFGRPVDQFNAAARARRNVAHHYDLNGQLYSLFLDRDLQYSCAYFPKGTETLEEAQTAKKRHIAAKLCLDRPGSVGARHRLRLGRHGADPRAGLRR